MKTVRFPIDRESFTAPDSCVYFLYLGEELLYIGSTMDFMHRMTCHRLQRDGRSSKFDSISYMEVEVETMREKEKELIEKHQPPFNFVHTKRSKPGRNPRFRVFIPIEYEPILKRMAAEQERSISTIITRAIDAARQSK